MLPSARAAELLNRAERLNGDRNYDEADKVATEALDVAAEAGGETLAVALTALSQIFAGRNPPDSERAVGCAERALAVRRGLYVNDDLRVTATVRDLGTILIRVGKREEAAKQLRIAEAAYAAWPGGAGSLHHRSVLRQLWKLALDAERNDEAFSLAERMAEHTPVGDDVYSEVIQEILGLSLLRVGRPAEAISHFEQLVQKRQTMDDMKGRSTSKTTAEAEVWLNEAREAAERKR